MRFLARLLNKDEPEIEEAEEDTENEDPVDVVATAAAEVIDAADVVVSSFCSFNGC